MNPTPTKAEQTFSLNKKLYSVFLLVVSVGMVLPTYAENKPGSFMAFYAFNKNYVYPSIKEGLEKACTGEKSFCQSSSVELSNEAVAYFSYRMTNEKSWDDFNLFMECAKTKNSSLKCKEADSYITKINNDFMDAKEQMSNLVKNDKTQKAVK